ncbi:hypothetical protein TthAA11_10090 [Thermus thermophilus]|uniref:Alpha-ketoacid dehydrogenase subunit beta n=1 Tax=Thermus thermophilus TaxID=274 RepID=A0AAD1NYC5_THETH|nr:hypothetical protein TthAA11_10090 [Thermus thermophilus]
MRVLNMVQAINEALDLALSRDERVLVFGEDVGRLGGGLPGHGGPAGEVRREAGL